MEGNFGMVGVDGLEMIEHLRVLNPREVYQWPSGLSPKHWEMVFVLVSGSVLTFVVDLAVGSFGWFHPNVR